ncbi:Hypothetical Protein CTN_1185 [Thermotoga neapolitana DSM 4359]|uniref:Uncharacterized protein n=1 Tax=Thermotoga neapolitana (strain ATCC 49049 / DSM 4359 / NBRC 107923 / NS-E) TaxID=309803 RepID=B9K8S8_THENN|nr:Hypothetical Protein CTN_1185 [Thermotoga neapolitana DSM 4359]
MGGNCNWHGKKGTEYAITGNEKIHAGLREVMYAGKME